MDRLERGKALMKKLKAERAEREKEAEKKKEAKPTPSKKGKLKCYTRTANDGHKYVTCDDKTTASKAMAKVREAMKEVNEIKGKPKLKKQFAEKAKAEIDPPKAKTPPKPKTPPRPADFAMLRPEIRKQIYSYGGNPRKIIRDKIIDINLNRDIKIRVIDSVLEDMGKGSLKEMNIKTTTPTYSAAVRRKMKALGRGFNAGGSSAREIYEILDDVEEALGLDKFMTFLPKVEDRLEGVIKQRKARQARERAARAEAKKKEKAEADDI